MKTAIHDDLVDLHGQEPEAALLAAFVTCLPVQTVVDVGAERGAFTQAMLRAGSKSIHAIEPEPANVEALRARFGDDSAVTIHPIALGERDGTLTLHRSTTPSGDAIPFGHTVLDRVATDEIAWTDAVTAPARTLASLVESGELPARVGILKVDTEGFDLKVVSAMGELDPDVVMVEHWSDLPHSLGLCPWTTDEIRGVLEARGFSHFACFAHLGELTILKWMDGTIPSGSFGNLVFMHDRVVADLLPDVLAVASSLAQAAVELAEARAAAAAERLEVIEDLSRERSTLEAVAAERLRAIEGLSRERSTLEAAAAERLVAIEDLSRERSTLQAAAAERLATIEGLERERLLLAEAAKDDVATIEELMDERDRLVAEVREHAALTAELERERDLQERAANERLVTIEALAAAAAERLNALEELELDRDVHAKAAKARLATIETLEQDLQRSREDR